MIRAVVVMMRASAGLLTSATLRIQWTLAAAIFYSEAAWPYPTSQSKQPMMHTSQKRRQRTETRQWAGVQLEESTREQQVEGVTWEAQQIETHMSTYLRVQLLAAAPIDVLNTILIISLLSCTNLITSFGG